MAGPSETDEFGDEIERRIARARERILGRLEPPPSDRARVEPGPPPQPAPTSVSGLDPALERRIQEAVAEIERRIQHSVEGRLQQAESRLDARAEALEATVARSGAASPADLDSRIADRLVEAERRFGDRTADVERRLSERAGTHDTELGVLRGEVRAVREALSQSPAGSEGGAGLGVEQRLLEASAALDARADELERRLEELSEKAGSEAANRLARGAEAAEARIASAERAAEREEGIRTRIQQAERESEQRVRAAERRLVEVLSQIERAGLSGSRSDN